MLSYSCTQPVDTVLKSPDGVTWAAYESSGDGTGAVFLGAVGADPNYDCVVAVSVQDNGNGDYDPTPSVILDPIALAIYTDP